jgi:heme exporter protein A
MAGRRPLGDKALLQALARTGLAGYEQVPCRHLSAGQQRRVALARLLVADEPLWLLDEVFTAIDASGVSAIENLLQERAAEGGAVVFTTHHKVQIAGTKRLVLTPGAVGYDD